MDRGRTPGVSHDFARAAVETITGLVGSCPPLLSWFNSLLAGLRLGGCNRAAVSAYGCVYA